MKKGGVASYNPHAVWWTGAISNGYGCSPVAWVLCISKLFNSLYAAAVYNVEEPFSDLLRLKRSVCAENELLHLDRREQSKLN